MLAHKRTCSLLQFWNSQFFCHTWVVHRSLDLRLVADRILWGTSFSRLVPPWSVHIALCLGHRVGPNFAPSWALSQSGDSLSSSRPIADVILLKKGFSKAFATLLHAHDTPWVVPRGFEDISVIDHCPVRRLIVFFLPNYGCDPPEGCVFQDYYHTTRCTRHSAGGGSYIRSSLNCKPSSNLKTIHIFHALMRRQPSQRTNFPWFMTLCLVCLALSRRHLWVCCLLFRRSLASQ